MRLIKQEDAGEVYAQEDAGEVYAQDETLRLPDFRLVLSDGVVVLVEVKNFRQTKGTEEILTFLWDCKTNETYDYKAKRMVSLFDHVRGEDGVFDLFAKLLGLALERADDVLDDRIVGNLPLGLHLQSTGSSRKHRLPLGLVLP